MSGIRVDQNILNQKGTPAFYAANYFDRPAAGFVGRIFISVNTYQIFRDEGTGWSLIADTGSGSSNLEQVTLNGNNTPYGINITNGGLFLLGSTNGSIFFAAGGSGQFTTDATTLFWDNTNKRLGLGTATPGVRLDVHSSSGTTATFNGTGVTNALLTFQSAGTSKWSVGNFVSSTVANDFNIYDNVNTVSRLQVHNTGVVNIPSTLIIGTTTPTSSYALDVTGSGNFTSSLLIGSNVTASAFIPSGATVPTNGMYLSAANTLNFATNSTNRFTINSTGVATFNSTTAGSILFNSTSQTYISIQNNGTTVSYLGSGGQVVSGGGANDVALTSNANNILFATSGGTERMRITSGGNVLINTTTDYGAKLYVNGVVGISTYSSTVKLYTKSDTATNASYAIGCENGSVNLFLVRGDGYMQLGLAANSPYYLSVSGRSAILDNLGAIGYLVSTRESKSNIKSISNVDFINQLNPVQFNYRKKDTITNTFTDEVEDNITYGFIADEVEKVNKELVFYDNLKNGSKKLAGVEYNSMIAILTKAIQELNEKLIRNNIN